MKAYNSGIDVTAEVVHLSRILNSQFVNLIFAYNEKSETLINGVDDHIKDGMRGLSSWADLTVVSAVGHRRHHRLKLQVPIVWLMSCTRIFIPTLQLNTGCSN